ncbi:hypothetical protein GCM10009798_43450 [Nocardioides panacihumi]|uniref:Phage major capsid protein n=1 Tax=Nocardioides panacihumi TaxID=400774 RepID=A0ABN2RZ41_9ACTN
MAELFTFEAATFAVDRESRTLTGVLLPFGEVSRPARDPSSGTTARYSFAEGTIDLPDPGDVVLNYGHDGTSLAAQVGIATDLSATPKGVLAKFKIARTPEGDRVLTLAEDRILRSFSAEVEGEFEPDDDGVHHATATTLTGAAVVPKPAFTGAQITSVAASAAQPRKEPNMGDEQNTQTPEAPDFSAVTDVIKTAISDGFAAFAVPGTREVVPAAGGQVQVNEPLPYRFDGRRAQFSLLDDLKARNYGDHDAAVRLEKFGEEAFEEVDRAASAASNGVAPSFEAVKGAAQFANVTTTNVSTLNPTPTRPELYVPNLYFSRPLWNLVTTGPLDNITSFIIPKFSASSGVVGTHTQGTEPTDGSFSTTSQTVNPAGKSGRVTLNREIVDQGGNPQVDQLIWTEMLQGFYAAIEKDIQAALAAVGNETDLQAGTATSDYALVNKLQQDFAAKQFVAGGDQFTAFASEPTLYGALVAAKDSQNRPLLPILGPTNSDGSLRASYESVQVGSKNITPAWALANANNANIATAAAQRSYWFAPRSVYAWASAPRRLDFEYQVASVVLGIWGYAATGITRNSDVTAYDMTTAD